jgi:hypothetical protein
MHEAALPAESFALVVAFAISQPEDIDINEILFRPRARSCKARGAVRCQLPSRRTCV